LPHPSFLSTHYSDSGDAVYPAIGSPTNDDV